MADLSIESKHTVGKRIAANTGLMVGSKSLAAILGLGSLSIAAKTIAPIELGTIIFLHVYMLFFSELATFQSWQSIIRFGTCLLYTSPSPRDATLSRMPSSA